MTIHVATTTDCNLGCTYCYQEPDREVRGVEAEVKKPDYDIEAIMERLEEWKEKYNEIPGLHGGEPLLMADEDVERIFRWIHDNYDGDGGHIQTNGTLITDKHIEMFQKYNVGVGISLDGPPELNRERVARENDEDDEMTDRMSTRTGRAITRLRQAGVSVGVIVVLHEHNSGTDEKLERLLSWIDNLNRMGVHGHYNAAIPYEDVQTDISLDGDRLAEVYVRTWEWMIAENHRTWNPMRDYQDNILGLRLGNCVMDKCDVFNAGAAKIIRGDGEATGCGKTWEPVGDGVPFLQGPSSGQKYDDSDERYEMLRKTPGWVTEDEPDMGGCKGCEYWTVCHGGCPSAGQDDDWRNRTWECKAIYSLYERIEEDLTSMFPNLRTVTDTPWDVSLGNENLAPFAEMNRHDAPYPSVSKHDTQSKVPTPMEQAYDDPNQMPFDEKVEYYREKYGGEHLTVDRDNRTIHADSAIPPEEADDGN